MFFYKNPFFAKGLSCKQRLHYIEIASTYIVSALCVPIIFLIPLLTLLTGYHSILLEDIYLVLRLPSLIMMLVFYYIASGKSFSTSQFWASLSFVYAIAFIKSLWPYKTKYKVTNKIAQKSSIFLITPHILYVGLSLYAFFYRVIIDGGLSSFTLANGVWILLMYFWFIPVFQKIISLPNISIDALSSLRKVTFKKYAFSQA